MTAANTTLGVFLPALRTNLSAQPGLAGVTISTGPIVSKTEVNGQSIQFGHVDETQDWYALGRMGRKETYKVACLVFSVVYGGDEIAITAARDGALALFAEVGAYLKSDPHVGGTVDVAAITSYTLDQHVAGKEDNARGAFLLFEIEVTATIR
jgi:hypothetical protein